MYLLSKIYKHGICLSKYLRQISLYISAFMEGNFKVNFIYNMKAILLVSLIALVSISEAKIFSRCELAKELVKHGIPRQDLANWVCLIEAESGRNSQIRGGPNHDGSYDNGLFQINDRWWCMNGKPGHDCHVRCEDLRSDDIRASVKCALLIKQRQGWPAWFGWQNKCRGRKLPNVDVCF